MLLFFVQQKQYYRLISPAIKNELLNIASGSSTREAITKSQLEEFKIPVPDLKTQHRIVAEITVLEQKVKAAQAVIDGAAARKAAIVKKHL